jgi:Tol biopolymer transport system component
LTSPITADLDIQSFEWSPSGEDIALSATSQDGNEDIYLLHLSPYTLSDLTPDIGQSDTGPIWSHDGKRIAFLSAQGVRTSQDCNEPGCLYRIYVIEKSGTSKLLVDEKDSVLDPHASQCMPDWSPDDKHLTFTHGCYVSEPAMNVYRYDFDTAQVSRLTSGETINRWGHWLSNEEILFRTFREGNEKYYVMSLDGKNQHPFVTWNVDDINSLSWTKDNRWFAWSTNKKHEIVIGDSHTGQTTQTDVIGCNPQWSPSGLQIAFSTDCLNSNGSEIWLMNRDTLQLTNLTANLKGESIRPVWAP